MRSVVLDTETTGMPVTDGHRIIEIGCVEVIGRRLTGRHYHVYLQPDREVDEGAIAVHGITNDFLTDTRGTGTISHIFSHYAREKARRRRRQNGVIIVQDPCTTAGYALDNLQDRGVLFVGPAVAMYAGQVLGIHSRSGSRALWNTVAT